MGEALLAECEHELDRFFALADSGALEPIALLFSELAGEQMTPDMILQVLRISEEQRMTAQQQRILLKCTKDQFMLSMRCCWEEGDSIATYKTLLNKHSARLENAQSICRQLRSEMADFMTRNKGNVDKVGKLFSELTPEPAKGKPLPPGMIHSLLRIPRDSKTCSLDDLVECFQRNLEATDSVEKLRPYLAKTY